MATKQKQSDLEASILENLSDENVEDILNERFGADSWKATFERFPWQKDQIRRYIMRGLECREIEKAIHQRRLTYGSVDGALLAESDGGHPCISPLQQLLMIKFAQLQALHRDLRNVLETPSKRKTGGDRLAQLQALRKGDD